MKRLILLFISVWASGILVAQKPFPYHRMDTIEINRFGVSLKNAWGGGLNTPVLNEIDLDWDGTKDLVVFDSYSGNIKTFLNDGISGTASYTHAPRYEAEFPRSLNLEQFMLLRDYNCDGKEDLFTYRLGGIAVYENIGSAATGHQWSLLFDYLPAIVFNQPSGVYISPIDIPSIEDMDGDGDLDILSTEVGGVIFYMYENTSTTCDTMIFERQNGCWGSFYESAFGDSLIFNAACKGGGGGNASRHAGSTMLTVDLNGDGAVELLVGDIESSALVAVYNSGTATNAQMTGADYSFPSTTISVDVQEFNAPYYIDVDNDNVKDLIVAPTNYLADDTDNVWLYKNNGSTNNANFSFVRKNFLSNTMVDLGKYSYPEFVDVNGDDLLDLLVGGLGYFQDYDPQFYTPQFNSGLAYFENTGDSVEPVFNFVTDDYQSLQASEIEGCFSTFGDLDGDGDEDMIAGTANGSLYYYENTAGAGNPMALNLIDTAYMNINNGPYATPRLVDLNDDTLLDLVVGEYNGHLNYHQNAGTAIAPQFSSTPTVDTLGGIHFYNPFLEGFISVDFGKADSTGELFAFVGTQDGTVFIYDSISQNLNSGDHFRLVDSIVTNNAHSAVAVDNINFSDSLELILGEAGGGISLWGRTSMYTPPNDTDSIGDSTFVRELLPPFQELIVYPNPAQENVSIQLTGNYTGEAKLSLQDLTGRVYETYVLSVTLGEKVETFDVSHLSSGTYLLVLEGKNEQLVKRLVIHK